MTVSELIAELQKLPHDLPVLCEFDDSFFDPDPTEDTVRRGGYHEGKPIEMRAVIL